MSDSHSKNSFHKSLTFVDDMPHAPVLNTDDSKRRSLRVLNFPALECLGRRASGLLRVVSPYFSYTACTRVAMGGCVTSSSSPPCSAWRRRLTPRRSNGETSDVAARSAAIASSSACSACSGSASPTCSGTGPELPTSAGAADAPPSRMVEEQGAGAARRDGLRVSPRWAVSWCLLRVPRENGRRPQIRHCS